MYLVEPFGNPPDRATTRSIVASSAVTLRPRSSPTITPRLRQYYEQSSKNSLEHLFLRYAAF